MCYLHRRCRIRSQFSRSKVVAGLGLAVLLTATMSGATSAAAAPSPGYTATRIPTGQESWFVAVDPGLHAVYFSDLADQITVIDDSTNAVTGTIALPAVPRGVAVNPATHTVYVALAATASSAPAVDVIDGTSDTVTATIPLPAASNPVGVAVDSATGTVYVAEFGAGAVAVINGSAVTANVSTGSGTHPEQLAVDENSDVVWAHDAGPDVYAISGVSNTLTQTISLGGVGVALAQVAVNPVSDTVYAATSTGVAVIDGASGTVTTTISGTRMTGVAVDAGSGTLFASSSNGALSTTSVIDTSTNTVVDTIPRGGVGVALDAATGSAYVAPYVTQASSAWALTPSATNALSPVITSAPSATFDTGIGNSFTVAASALPAATLTETGALPADITLSPSGILSGTPAVSDVGTYPITITATNGLAPDYSQSFTLTIVQLPSITAPSSVTFTVGSTGSFPIQATGNPPVTGVSLAPGSPSWLSVIPNAGGGWTLTGTPPAGSGGVYNPVVLTATSSAGTTNTNISVTVLEAPSITSAPATTWLADGFDGFSLSVRGYPVPVLTLTGSPQGVAVFDPPNAQLQEEPPLGFGSIGVHHFTINATNSLGTASQAFTLTVRSPVAVGAEGTDGELWAQAPQLPSGWQPLGGQITGPPAVAAPPTNISQPVQPLFIATGTDGHLWIRSLTATWQPLDAFALCVGAPAAVITGTPQTGPFTLTVACRGTDNALWVNSAPVPTVGVPVFTSRDQWTSLGGVLSAAPAAAPVAGTMTFFVRGTNGQIFTRTVSSGYVATPWSCNGSPAASTVEFGTITYVAFQGTDHALWETTNSGSGWSAPVQFGGTLIGGPAVAANGNEPYMLGEGTDHAAWERTNQYDWSSLGGSVVGGVGAANLTA